MNMMDDEDSDDDIRHIPPSSSSPKEEIVASSSQTATHRMAERAPRKVVKKESCKWLLSDDAMSDT